MGIDDSNYQVSSKILSQLNQEIEIIQPTKSSSAMLNALCSSVKERDLQTVRAVLQFRFDVNLLCNDDLDLRNNNVLSELLVRTNSGKYSVDELAILEELLTAGANPNTLVSPVFWKLPILAVVISTDNIIAAKLLVKFGADPNMYYREMEHLQYTTLFKGVSIGSDFSSSLLGWLIDQGADFMMPILSDTGWISPGPQSPACLIITKYNGRSDLMSVMVQKIGFDEKSCENE